MQHLKTKEQLRQFVLFTALLFSGACQQDPAFLLDFGSSRLEVIINGQTYASGSTYNWGNVSNGDAIVINGSLRNRSAFSISITGTVPITVSGDHAADVSVTQPANMVIPAGATQNFALTITPEMRSRSAKLTIISAPGNDIFTLNITGFRYGIYLLKDINPGVGSGLPSSLAVIGANLYFRGNDGANGAEPWISDGTTGGTMMIHNINAAGNSSNPTGFTLMGSTVFFSADNGTNGDELWRTNGTSAGTFMVRDIDSAGNDSSNPSNFCVFNGSLFFRATTAAAGYELWKTDGTFAGTVMVADARPGISNGHYGNIFAHSATRIVFDGHNGTNRTAYRSTGTVGDFDTITDGSVDLTETIHGGFYSFSGATIFSTASGIWKITNTSATSANRFDSTVEDAANFATLANSLLFSGEDATAGRELWISDSSLTAGGTIRLKDINAGITGSNPDFLTTTGSRIFFKACETATDCELWMTDGTSPGTVRVRDINPGAGVGSNPANLTALGSILYFTATDGTNGVELWRSDGTESGTYMVADINAGAASSSPANLRVLNGALVFSATTVANGTELFLYVPPP